MKLFPPYHYLSLEQTATWCSCRLNSCHFHERKILHGYVAHHQYILYYHHHRRYFGRWNLHLWNWLQVTFIFILRTLNSPDAFYMVNFDGKLITLFAVFGFAGLWMIFWFFYSNSFVIMSAASIWYYQ